MKLQQVFIENLRYYRKLQKMTQNDLTLALNKSYNYVNGLEQGKYFPSLDVIEEISRILNIQPIQLFDEKSNERTYIAVNHAKIVQEITDNICHKLKSEFRKEITDILQYSCREKNN